MQQRQRDDGIGIGIGPDIPRQLSRPCVLTLSSWPICHHRPTIAWAFIVLNAYNLNVLSPP